MSRPIDQSDHSERDSNVSSDSPDGTDIGDLEYVSDWIPLVRKATKSSIADWIATWSENQLSEFRASLPGRPDATPARANPTDYSKAIEYLLAHAGDLSQEETPPSFSYHGRDLTQLVHKLQCLVKIFKPTQRKSKKIRLSHGSTLKATQTGF
jgi:hypothetical protein